MSLLKFLHPDILCYQTSSFFSFSLGLCSTASNISVIIGRFYLKGYRNIAIFLQQYASLTLPSGIGLWISVRQQNAQKMQRKVTDTQMKIISENKESRRNFQDNCRMSNASTDANLIKSWPPDISGCGPSLQKGGELYTASVLLRLSSLSA